LPIEPGNRAQAQALGRKSGAARRRLTLEDAARECGPLLTEKDAMRRADHAYLLARTGLLPGTVVNAMVRAVEVWLKAHDLQTVQRRLRAVEQELAAARAGGPRRVAP